MRTGAAQGHEGCFHETGFYGSDDEYLALAVPYVLEAVAAGEPVYVTASEPTADLVRRSLPSTDGVTFVPASVCYVRPAVAIREYRDALQRDVAAGARQVRVLAEVPHPGLGVPWESWRRYEAAANLVYDDFPVWGRCLYDTRSAPPEVVDDARRTHPMIATPGGQLHNAAFVAPEAFLREAQSQPVPPEAGPADLALVDPSPGDARRSVAAMAAAVGLPQERCDDLVTAVSEAVANALEHGTPPVALNAWARGGQVVVTVRDCGPGPGSPLAGLVPVSSDRTGGLGLWILHQLLDEVGLHRDGEGFTLRLAASA